MTIRLIAIQLLLLLTPILASASVNFDELVKDLSKSKINDSSIRLVIWMPSVYWELSAQNISGQSATDIQNTLLILEPFEIFAVVDAVIDTKTAEIRSNSYSSVVEKSSLSIVGGDSFKALPESELSPMLRQVLELVRPVFAKMLGQLGDGLHLLAFAADTPIAAIDVDPRKKGRIQFSLAEDQFSWRLPLGSLLPARYDPDTNETFPGTFEYSPYTGEALIERRDVAPRE
jgi:hypothetical protein